MADLSFGRESTPITRDSSVADILAAAAEVLNLKPSAQEYLTPCRNRVYYEFLGELTGKTLLHVYGKIPRLTMTEIDFILEDNDVILHSHDKTTGCSGPTFCHLLGYTLTGAEHPSFIKAFNQTWKKNEKEVRDTPTGVSQSDGLSSITFG